jgi:excinuclease UvrABC nuclease subunit
MRPRKPLPRPLDTGRLEIPLVLDLSYVYRAYCRCGDLLYVGVTCELFTRMAWHRRQSRWEFKMARLEWETYRTRAEADRVEKHLIDTLNPLYNKAREVPWSRRSPLPMPRAFTDAELDRCAIAAYRGKTYLEWAFSELDKAA